MGEAKRRKETDPDYGVKPQIPPENPILKQIKKISKLEWILWGIFLGTSVVFSARSFMQ